MLDGGKYLRHLLRISCKVLQEITQAVFNDDLKLHFYIQSKITTEDNKVGTLMGKDIFNENLKLHF